MREDKKLRELVSIIIPVYNSQYHLEECLQSVLYQTYKPIEIILINDGSIDKSERICTEYAKNHDNIVYISQKNGGVSSARNQGIKKAIGKYVLFLDSDDILLYGNAIENMVDIAEEYDSKLILTERVLFKEKELFFQEIKKDAKAIKNKEIIFDTNIGCLLDLNIIKENNILFDENLKVGEDTVFAARYNMKCDVKKFYKIDNAIYGYRKNNENSLSFGEWGNNQRALQREIAILNSMYNYLDLNLDPQSLAIAIYFIRKKKNAIKYILMQNESITNVKKYAIPLLKRKIPIKLIINAQDEIINKKKEFLFRLPFMESVFLFKILYGIIK